MFMSFPSARSLTNSLSYDFTFPIISSQNDSNATIKCVLQNLCELACRNSKNGLRQRLVKQRFFKSVSLITGFEKTVLGCHSKGSSFGEQALAQ